MTSPADPDLSSWECPSCGTVRAAEDDFCGRCGRRRLSGGLAAPGIDVAPGDPDGSPALDAPEAPEIGAPTRAPGSPVRRALVLNGLIVAGVMVAVLLGRGNGGPGAVTFQPGSWRCDGTGRTWTARIPASALDVRLEWREGTGPEGELRASSTTPRTVLEPFLAPDGTYRVTSNDPAAPECTLSPGTYTLALRDAANNALLAFGQVELAP